MTIADQGTQASHDEAAASSVELDRAGEDGSVGGGAMVGIAIRLPATTLDAARSIAHDRGVKVTAMLREWIDQRVAERVDDARVVSVGDLRRLIAHRAHDPQPVSTASSADASGGGATTTRLTTPSDARSKAKLASGGKTKRKASGGTKSKDKSSGHRAFKSGPKAD